jgi:hypothetical protein
MNKYLFRLIILPVLLINCNLAYSQLQTYNVLPNLTDNQINQALEVHYAAINRSVTLKNRLMIFFPGTGGIPRGYKTFTELAANKGFHAFSLQYVNADSVNDLCSSGNDLDCYERCRLEIIDGTDRTTLVNVNRPNSIENRIIKLIKYLHNNNPNDGWLQYLDANDNIRWDKIVVAGHSQGGGHAGIIGKKHKVARVIMFAAADFNVNAFAPANWISALGLTPSSDFYGFMHQRDQLVNYGVVANRVWTAYGMSSFGVPVNVDNITTPFNNTHSLNSDWTILPVGSDYHSATIVDTRFPVSNGEPVYKSVWEYLLTIPVINGMQADFDGDAKTDISIFRPNVAQWWYLRSSDNANRAFQFGNSTDKIVPADYTGDGKTDIATFTPTTGFWNILRSEDSTFYGFPFGTNGDIAAPADYDGDGKADPAVFRTSNSTWFISKSSGGTTIQQFGATGDKPVVADYDGDGKADLAIYRVALGQWWRLNSSDGTNRAFTFGTPTDKPIQGDYTGDGKADLAFFRPSTGEWFVLRSEDSTFYAFPFGVNSDIPATGDYDGDGRADAAVFRPSAATWFLNRSTAGTQIVGFGANGDQPVPNAFVP